MKYHSPYDLTLPLLKSIEGGNEYLFRYAVENVIIKLNLNKECKTCELLKDDLFIEQLIIAEKYLKSANLITNPRFETIKITDFGKSVLNTNPDSINKEFLKNLFVTNDANLTNGDSYGGINTINNNLLNMGEYKKSRKNTRIVVYITSAIATLITTASLFIIF